MSAERRMLSEAEAWREIARQIAEGCGYFMCCGVDDLRLGGRVTEAMGRAMLKRVDVHLHGHMVFQRAAAEDAGEDADDFTYDELVDCRVLAALWLALEAEDDAERAS